MNLLIDESLPRGLKRQFPGHYALTVPDCGWASKSNGVLLDAAAEEFDVFLTGDQNIEHQQDLGQFDIGIIVLAAASNRMANLLPLVPNVLAAIGQITPGTLIRVGP